MVKANLYTYMTTHHPFFYPRVVGTGHAPLNTSKTNKHCDPTLMSLWPLSWTDLSGTPALQGGGGDTSKCLLHLGRQREARPFCNILEFGWMQNFEF
jgi:hypothetical protein